MKFPRCWGFLPTRSTVTKEGQAARQAASGARRRRRIRKKWASVQAPNFKVLGAHPLGEIRCLMGFKEIELRPMMRVRPDSGFWTFFGSVLDESWGYLSYTSRVLS